MADQTPKPASPFSGLDKALLRSTQQQPAPVEETVKTPFSAPSRKQAASRSRQPASKPDSNQASELASTIASKPERDQETIEAIRKAVKDSGKEVAFIRLTREEKHSLADIVYTYKRQGKKTTENEVARIALNSLLIDYKANGERSMLARVIEALLA
jgi:hypothetical protein